MTNFEADLEQLRNEYNELVKRNERQYDIIKDLESILEEMEEKLNEEIEVRPKGYWIPYVEENTPIMLRCSMCTHSVVWGSVAKYCPNCGAEMKDDMRGE